MKLYTAHRISINKILYSTSTLYRSTTASCTHSFHSTSFLHSTAQSSKIDVHLIKQLRELVGAPMNECKQAIQHAQANHHSNIIESAIEWLRKSGKSAAAKKSTRSAAEGLICITRASVNDIVISEINSETDFAAKNDKFADLAEQINHTLLNQSQYTNRSLTTEQINTINGGTINDVLTDTITSLRENILVRRAYRLQTKSNQVISSYIHNSSHTDRSSKLGRTGAIVVLSTSETELNESQIQAINELGTKLAMHVVAIQPLYANKSDVPSDIIEHERAVLMQQSQNILLGKSNEQLNKIVQGKLNKYYEDNVLSEQKFVVVSGDDKPQPIHKILSQYANQLNIQSIHIDTFIRYAVGETVAPVTKMSFADEVKSKMQ